VEEEDRIFSKGSEKIYTFYGKDGKKEVSKEELEKIKKKKTEQLFDDLERCLDNEWPFLVIVPDKEDPDIEDYVLYASLSSNQIAETMVVLLSMQGFCHAKQILAAVEAVLTLHYVDKLAETSLIATLQNAKNVRFIGG